MTPALALLPSPFLGPAVWEPVGQLLIERGWQVHTPRAALAPRTPQDVLDGFLAALPYDDEVILVPHSNAGLYVPAIAAQRQVRGFVFVDALLPPAEGDIDLAPPAPLWDALLAKADPSGLLPPWTTWWAADDIAPLFPDRTTRRRVEGEQRRLPLSYFEGSLRAAAGWDQQPGAYLAFGETYGRDRDAARSRGWPVVTLPGAHLHMLVEPEQVANEILAVVDAGSGRTQSR